MPEIITIPAQEQQLLSEDMSDFISHKPHWIIRKGNLIILLVLLCLLSLSWLVEYPDMIRAPMKIVAVNAPQLLTIKKEGRLQRLMIKNEEEVRKGQPLVFLQNLANHQQVLDLYGWIESVETFLLDSQPGLLTDKKMPAGNELGELEPVFADLKTACGEAFAAFGLPTQNNKEEAPRQCTQMNDQRRQQLLSVLNKCKHSLQEWISHYIVTAPADGRIDFINILQENQMLQANQELFYLVPLSNSFYGEIQASQYGLGKIKKDQKVIVRINSYPSAEFGYLSGKIDYIPMILKNDNNVGLRVSFENGLKTNYGNQLIFKNNMTASAEIITNNRKLPERFAGRLREMFFR
jgi:hypothetical protein